MILTSLTPCADMRFVVTQLPPHQPTASKGKPSKTAHSDALKPSQPRQKPTARARSPDAPPPHTTTRVEIPIQNEKTGHVLSVPPPSKPPPTSRPRQRSSTARASSPDLPSPRTAMREAVSARSAKKKGTVPLPPPSKPAAHSSAAVVPKQVSNMIKGFSFASLTYKFIYRQ